jgi:hypothetical protein
MKASLALGFALFTVNAGCGGEESSYAGMTEDEAGKTVHSRVERAQPPDTFLYPADAVKATTPHGVDAWLVKVDFESHSAQVCAYVWRDQRKRTRFQEDGGCRHWEY